MTFRSLIAVALPFAKCAAGLSAVVVCMGTLDAVEVRAADCINATDNGVSLVASAEAKADCGELKVVDRHRDDPRPNIGISALYVEFKNPRNAGEWRYNEAVRKSVEHMQFEGSVQLAPDAQYEDKFAIESFYQSPRIISARFHRWVCCGAHGAVSNGSINIDAGRWTFLVPGDFVNLSATANLCWQQFADQKGKDFVDFYPRERLFSEDDFRTGLRNSRPDMIGSILVNPDSSPERTYRIFTSALRGSGNWSFTERGALVDFGELLGYVGAPFTCVVDSEHLRERLLPGVSLPL